MFLTFNSLTLRRRPLLTLAAGALSAVPALAAPYTAGDLVLGFVAGAGTGADQTLLVNLGPASGFRDGFDAGTSRPAFVTIGPRLAAQFGPAWYDRTDLYVSLFGTTSTSVTSSTLYSGDPARTLYVSFARDAAGVPGTANSGGWSLGGDTAMTGSAIAMNSVTLIYAKATADAQNVAVISDDEPNTLDEVTRPATSTSFNNFTGGIEQILAAGPWGTFGDAGEVEAALDLYRLQARANVAGQYGSGADNRQGVYKGTITLTKDGVVSFIAKGNAPADGFSDWAAAKGLPAGAAADDDRDGDGIPALTEYALDLNPLAADTLPQPAVSGAGVRLTFTKGAAAAADARLTYQIESSSTLNADWKVVTPDAGPAGEISALLPAGDASGRLFGRLKVTRTN